MVHDVAPGKAENGPAPGDELVLASPVMMERIEGGVELVAVDLDGDTVVGVCKIDPPDQPWAAANLVLTDGLWKTLVATQAQHPRFDNRLGQILAVGAHLEQPTEDAGALTPSSSARIENRAEARQRHQLAAEGNLEAAFDGPRPLDGTEVEDRAKRCRDGDPVSDGTDSRREITRAVHDHAVDARLSPRGP
jgi:hypothetical protein